jgi:hypothetical protein
MKRFKNLDEMVKAIKRDELPKHIVSPGDACAVLGISRQAMHELCKRGTIPAWYAERVILIDADAVQAYSLKKRGVPDGQRDLYATR